MAALCAHVYTCCGGGGDGGGWLQVICIRIQEQIMEMTTNNKIFFKKPHHQVKAWNASMLRFKGKITLQDVTGKWIVQLNIYYIVVRMQRLTQHVMSLGKTQETKGNCDLYEALHV